MDVLETERLVLRRLTEADGTFLLALMNDPDWLRHIGDRGVRTIDDARAYIAGGLMRMYEEHGFGLYLVELKAGRTPVGVCGLIKRDYLDDADLGFALAREHRGRGYAREAAAATLTYGRDAAGLSRIAAIVSPGNGVSVRLLESLGFSFDRKIDQSGGDEVLLFGRELERGWSDPSCDTVGR